jgi:tetratricopeptide (TPR) repeat protein
MMENLEAALGLLRSGKLREGMAVLERLRRDEPEDVDLLYNLGMCYSELGMLDKSIETLEMCMRLAPDHANALTALGFSYSRNGEQDKALAALTTALEIDPDNFFASRNQGAVLAKLGRYEDAIRSFQRANRLNPDNPEVLYGLALAHKHNGALTSADELFKQLIEANKDLAISELAKTGRREIALDSLKSKGFRIDAVMYCLSALELFSSKGRDEIFAVVSEIALLGRHGLDINNPEKKYRLKSLKGDFSGLHLLCCMYVGFRIYDDSIDIGADLSSEYQAAIKLFAN